MGSKNYPDMVPDYGEPKKGRGRRTITEADLGLFLKQYGRKAQPAVEPNDRSYSRRLEKNLKRMPPEDLDRLMRGEETQE